jgi:penicillin-binding protein 2
VTPQIVQRVLGPDGRVLTASEPQIQGKVPASPATLRFVRDALKGVINEPRGTGQKAKVPGLEAGGKTGTAQVVRLGDRPKGKRARVPKEHQDHAWFVSFAPVEDAKIAVAVIVEHGGGGGAEAAPVAQRVMQAFFQKIDARDRNGDSKDATNPPGGVDRGRDHPSPRRDRNP